MPYRVALVVTCLAAMALVACGSGQTSPSLNVIEVDQRTSMMTGLSLDPLDETLRRSGNVMSAEDALAAAKSGAFGPDAAPLEYPDELRFYLGTFYLEAGLSPAVLAMGPDPRLGHAYYAITSNRQVTCAPGGGPITITGTPSPPRATPGPCRWEITVDATTGEVQGMTVAPACPEFPLPRTCR